MSFTIGSLFDGSGGFPLSAYLCGGTPKWASEVEPYPIAVTRSRFPNMKHLGDISKINGAEVEPVDVITFGSPCQDLSVAGKRAGLKHEANGDEETTRSGLFMEAVRIIKEMREATHGKYPRFALWENVPGAFSSNKGEDFRIVLEELIKIVEPGAIMPEVPKKGWAYADSMVGDGWSLAYRVFDAQYWGVPQRRRRIHLVLDLGGECAREVLFERDGLRGDLTPGRAPRQGTASDSEGSLGANDITGEGVSTLTPWDSQGNQVYDGTNNHVYPCLRGCGGAGYQAGYVLAEMTCAKGQDLISDDSWGSGFDGYNGDLTGDKTATLGVNCGISTGRNGVIQNLILDDQGGQQISVRTDEKSPTLRAEAHGNVPCVVESGGFCPEQSAKTRGIGWEEETSPTLRAGATPGVVYTLEPGIAKREGGHIYEGVSGTLRANAGDNQMSVAYGMETFHCTSEEEKVPTLKARDWKDPHTVCYWDGSQTCGTLTANNAGGNQRMPDKENFNCVVDRGQYVVRRLTPTECARLQGFPDLWGHFPEKSDFTEEEYAFWQEVRNTHAEINGKVVKDYTEKQLLTWYNKLHTDSAEYKMWGNGIALPTALYCMEGIAEVLHDAKRGNSLHSPESLSASVDYPAI